jgi:hypothetical protein
MIEHVKYDIEEDNAKFQAKSEMEKVGYVSPMKRYISKTIERKHDLIARYNMERLERGSKRDYNPRKKGQYLNTLKHGSKYDKDGHKKQNESCYAK